MSKSVRAQVQSKLKAKYLAVIKQAFLIELSADFDYKLCGHYINREMKVFLFRLILGKTQILRQINKPIIKKNKKYKGDSRGQ